MWTDFYNKTKSNLKIRSPSLWAPMGKEPAWLPLPRLKVSSVICTQVARPHLSPAEWLKVPRSVKSALSPGFPGQPEPAPLSVLVHESCHFLSVPQGEKGRRAQLDTCHFRKPSQRPREGGRYDGGPVLQVRRPRLCEGTPRVVPYGFSRCHLDVARLSLDVCSHSLAGILASPREDWREKGPFGNGTVFPNPAPSQE